jgi:hypothetical protein
VSFVLKVDYLRILIVLQVSFTGSEHVGRVVGKTVMSRFGKVILELGGNNGTVYTTGKERVLTYMFYSFSFDRDA